MTLQEAKDWYTVWSEAYKSIAVGGQSYKIGTRQLTRADLDEVRKQMDYWRNEVDRLERGRGRGVTLKRVVIRDL